MADVPLTTMADRIRWARFCAGFTGTALAHKAGVTPATISRLENGKSAQATARTLHAIADALGVSMLWLWRGEGGPPDPEAIRRAASVVE